MQLNLRIREPIVERYDDTAAQDSDATTTEALAVLNEEETIRNRGVLSQRKIGRDIWIHAHDAAGQEIGKRKRIFNSDLGIDEMPVGVVTRRQFACENPTPEAASSGVIDGIGSARGRFRSQGIHSFGSVSEVSRTMVRFEGSRICNRVMSSRSKPKTCSQSATR